MFGKVRPMKDAVCIIGSDLDSVVFQDPGLWRMWSVCLLSPLIIDGSCGIKSGSIGSSGASGVFTVTRGKLERLYGPWGDAPAQLARLESLGLVSVEVEGDIFTVTVTGWDGRLARCIGNGVEDSGCTRPFGDDWCGVRPDDEAAAYRAYCIDREPDANAWFCACVTGPAREMMEEDVWVTFIEPLVVISDYAKEIIVFSTDAAWIDMTYGDILSDLAGKPVILRKNMVCEPSK